MPWTHDSSLQDECETGSEPPIRLLAVDDEPSVLRSLRALFRGDGYQLELADNGNEALERLGQRPFDVILSDMRFPEPMRIVLSGYAEPDKVIGVLNEAAIFAYVNKPWDNADLRMKVRRAAEQLRLRRLIEHQNDELAVLNRSLKDKVRERTVQLEQTNERLRTAMADLEESYGSVVRMLAHMVDRRAPSTMDHGMNVARTARRLAEALRLPLLEIRDIETAALLHDIGLAVIPDELLTLSSADMSQEQLTQFQRHTLLGEATLIGIPAMRRVAAIVRSHHEFHDGSGYPNGLAGEAIPMGARIVTLANDYQELLAGQFSDEPLTEAEAHDWMRRDSGHRYEPRLLDLFVNLGRIPAESDGIQVDEVIRLRSEDLQPGMVLCEKLLSRDGMLLLSAGQRVTHHAIEAIRRLERIDGSPYLIYILDQAETGEAPGPSLTPPSLA